MKLTKPILYALTLIVLLPLMAQEDDQPGLRESPRKNVITRGGPNNTPQIPKPPKDDPQARLEFELLKVRNPTTGEVPDAIRARELAFMKSQKTRFSGNQLLAPAISDWSNRGPFNVGGRTRALAVDVLNPTTILAGGVSGGMWRSADEGATWSKTTGSNELQSVTCIAQDTRSGFESTWYYGTGENRGNSAASFGASYLGNGVYKSTDNGLSWSLLTSTASNTPESFENRFDLIHEIVVDPTNGDVYVATYDGLYKSENGGDSFFLYLGGAVNTTWVDIAVTSTGVLFAALDQLGVFRSEDGENWTDITPVGFPLARNQRKELAIAPSNEHIVYVIGEDLNHASDHTLWKFDDSDDSWEDRSANIPMLGGLTGDFDSQGSYNLLIKVKNDDPDFVIIGGTNLFRSTDGFSSTNNTTWIGGYTPTNASYALYFNHHPDQHSFVFLSGDRALSGNDGGVQITEDITTTLTTNQAVAWTPLNNGYLTTQVYAVSAGPGDQILAGFQDNGTWFTTNTDGTLDWNTPFGGDGAYSAISSDGSTRYLSSQNGNIYRYEYSSANDETLDDAAYFTPDGYSAGLFIVPFYLDPLNDDIFYLAGSSDLYVNTSASTGDNLTGWKSISLGGSTVSELGVSNDGFVVAGTMGGEVYKVTDPAGDHAVSNITGSNFPSGYISGIDVNRFDPNEIIVCFSNYEIPSVFHTTNGGVTWTDVSGNLEENPDGSGSGTSTRTVRILGDGTGYFVGTSTGLYTTQGINGSSTEWTQEDVSGIGDVVVEHLVTKLDGTVIAGTHGNGVFSAQFDLGAEIIDLEVTDILNPNNSSFEAENEVEVRIVNRGTVSVNQFDLTLRIDGSEIVTEAVNVEITAGGIYEHTFGTTVDLTAKDTYEFDIELVLGTDENQDNNRIIESVSNTPFVGTYLMEQIALTTTGPAAAFAGGTIFSGTGNITVNLEYVDEDTRSFGAQYVSQLGYSGLDTYYFDLIDGAVIFGDNQDTFVDCSSDVIFGPAETPGVFNANDDSSFTLTLKEDINDACSTGSADVEFTLTRADGIEVNATDRAALIALYNATDGPNWTNTWDISESVFEWFGVVASSEGRVIELTLAGNNLTGTLPTEIGDLTELSNLSLTGNNLEGSIPAEIGNLSNLDGLVMDDMELSGDIPEELWNLTNLTRLNLDFNDLEGHISPSIGNLVNLESLDLDGNQFTGELPSEISLLTNLTLMDLDFNSLSGSIPESIGTMTQLTFIDLSHNQFTGEVPSSYSNLTNMNFIDLSNNQLDVLPDLTALAPSTFNVSNNNFDFGDLVPNISSLTTYAPQNALEAQILRPSLSELMTMEIITTDDGNLNFDWFFNDASFISGFNPIFVTYNGSEDAGVYRGEARHPLAPDLTITQEYTVVDNAITSHPDYAALEAFYISTNGSNWTDNSNWLTGSNLDDWYGITTNIDGRVSSMIIQDNNLTGTLPSEIGDLSDLVTLDLYLSDIGGSIPSEIGNLTSLTFMDLLGEFTGSIPDAIGDMSAMEVMRISSPYLTGAIPSSLGNLTNLTFLNLTNGELSGDIPDIFGGMTDLATLDLQDNQLTGGIPASLLSLSNLNSINVFENNLTDLSDLTSLPPTSVIASRNKLDFSDIVPNISVLNAYDTQDNIDDSYFEVINEGSSTTLEVSDVTAGNSYEWYLNDELINGATGATYTISNFNTQDVGIYYCEITNPSAPDLFLRRNSITLDINRLPSDIQLTNSSIEENNDAGDLIGVLSVIDEDSDSHTFSTSNTADFQIGGVDLNELRANTSFNFESQSSISLEITAEDDLGARFTESFTINIEDRNDPPSDILLSNNLIDEGESTGTAIGTLTVTDEDEADTHTLSIGGIDASDFLIGGSEQNELQSNAVFDAQTKNSFMIEVTAIDGGSAQFTKAFTITIEEVEVPLGADSDNNLVKVYPNPSNGNFYVIIDPSLVNPSWMLTDLSGKEIELQDKAEISNRTIVFEIGTLGTGVYLLKIQSESSEIVKRIIIE